MRGIASHAPRLKAMGSPKALGNRCSGRAGELPEGAQLLAEHSGLARWWDGMAKRPSLAATRSAMGDS